MIENTGTLGHKCVIRNQALPTSNEAIVATSFPHHLSIALNIQGVPIKFMNLSYKSATHC